MITITPEAPTSDSTVIFTFTGGSGCPVISKTITESTYQFEVSNSDGPCLGTRIPYEYSWNAGRLEAGEYEVVHLDAYEGATTQAFVVAGGELPFPQTIPTLSSGVLVGLAVLIAWLAVKSLRRNRRA